MERQHHPYRATAFMLMATVFFCLSDALGKWLTAIYPVVQITWMRSIFGAAALLLAAALTSNLRALKTRRPAWHVGRSIASGVMVLGVFYGLKNIPLAEFVAITFSVPFFIAVFSPGLLKEQVAKQSWIAITLGFIGVLFVLRPTPDHFHIAHLTTLGLSLVISLMLLSARYLSTTETGWSLNFYLPVAAIVLLGYPTLVYWIDPSNLDWALFAMLGVSQTIALGCYIEALRLARAAVIAPLDYLRMIWTIIVGYLIWQELPDSYTWAGIAIIVASGIYIVRHSYVNRTEHA